MSRQLCLAVAQDPVATLRAAVADLLPPVSQAAADLLPDSQPERAHMEALRDSLVAMRRVLGNPLAGAGESQEPLDPTKRLLAAGENLCQLLETVTAGDNDSPEGRKWPAAIAQMRTALREVGAQDVKASQRAIEAEQAAAEARTQQFFSPHNGAKKPAFHRPEDGLC
jgi:hypothetical protein